MKLTKKDKTTLLSLGCLECDFKQIEKVISKTKYILYKVRGNEQKRICRASVINLIGRDAFLSGINRSAFHCTAVRYVDDENAIYFDSNKYFDF
jgi:hypothetical protein